MSKMIIITGPTAAGKDSLAAELLKKFTLKPLVSYTTRPMREVETDGVEYIFIDDDQFHELVKNNKIMSSRTYNTIQKGEKAVWNYGAPYPQEDVDYITIVDHQGVKNIQEAIGKENTIVIYLDGKFQTLEARCKNRGDEMAEFYRRLADDRKKFMGIEKLADLEIQTTGYTIQEVAQYAIRYLSTNL